MNDTTFLDQVIAFFGEKVDQLEQRSAECVKEVLETSAKQFPLDRLKVNDENCFCLKLKLKFQKFPDLKFKYVEEEQPEDFFVPYIWNLGNHLSYLFLQIHNDSYSSLQIVQSSLVIRIDFYT